MSYHRRKKRPKISKENYLCRVQHAPMHRGNSSRHKRRKLEDVSNKAKRVLNDDQFEVEGVTLRNKDTGTVQFVENKHCS